MTRRSILILPSSHDGTSQRGRALPALEPGYVAIDERSTADLLAFVQKFAAELRYHATSEDGSELREAGSWKDFVTSPDISIADIVAYIAEPERFTGEAARWLGRPHFVLLLAFLELLGHARTQLGELTARHLDYFYRDILQMLPEPARPDRATVVFRLASRVSEVFVPAGSALDAGRDADGVERIYRTERDLVVSRAQVAGLRSLFVDRRITGIPDVRKNRDRTASEAFDGTLRIALGVPAPGDAIPPWRGAAIDRAFFVGLRGSIDIASTSKNLYLAHHELRSMMRLVHRRDAGAEWPTINSLLGVTNPSKPRDFLGNLESRVGVLDFQADGLPEVDDVDDLYSYRTEPDVAAYIENRMAPIGGMNTFVAVMPLKLRIDAEWAEIDRLLALAGQRKRSLPSWSFPQGFDPTAFAQNLALALDSKLPSWPWGTSSIYEYEDRVRELEGHLYMSIERIDRLVTFASKLEGDRAEDYDWSDVDRILADAHREKTYAARRAVLAEVRGSADSVAGFDTVVTYVLSRPSPPPAQPIAWTEARKSLLDNRYLEAVQIDVLDRFRTQLGNPGAGRTDDWPDIYRVLELAQRHIEELPEPVAVHVEWRNLFAYEDARTQRDDAASSLRWKTFGGLPAASTEPPTTSIGWGLSSPVLSLAQGKRTLTVTLGLVADSFDRDAFLRALGLDPATFKPDQLRGALAAAWVVEISTAKGWIELDIAEARMAAGKPGDDYWSLHGAARPRDEDRPALQLGLVVAATRDAIAALPGTAQPVLRAVLRQRWDSKAKEWTTLLDPFDPLQLAAVHVRVAVDGLTDLEIQRDDQVLDPRKPFEPFGRQPRAGARLYVGHPELLRGRLDTVRFDITWMGMPGNLATHYGKYPDIKGAVSFKADVALIDRNLELGLVSGAGLFASNTSPDRSLSIDVPGALEKSSPGFAYERRDALAARSDLRASDRAFRLELGSDFGHDAYPALASRWAGELAVAISNKTINDSNPVTNYQVNAPYTPTIKQLRASYTTAIEIEIGLDLAAASTEPDRLLHLHPFGETPIPVDVPSLLPRYHETGELYIGLRDLDPAPGLPRHLSLLIQLAEGTSNPDIAPAPVSWSCLDGDAWRELDVLHDSTRGLINSGIVELALPVVAPSTRLPGPLYWVRAAIPSSADSVCDAVDIRAQAVSVTFEDRGNADAHYAKPLAIGSIKRLVEPDARIAAIEQPFTSSGGKPAEQPEVFRTRVSERLRHKQRALSAWDYERLVLQRFGQIFKVKCLPAGTEPGRVAVIVIPDIRHALPGDAFAPRASADVLADIQAYLGERSPAGARIEVRNAHYVPVLVRLGVRFVAGVDEGFASRKLEEDLVRFLSPWAYDEGAELMIGGKIYATSILDFVDRRDYVDYAADIKLFRGSGKDDFTLIPVTNDYHVATDRPDQVLVAARHHIIDIIPEFGYQQELFTGIAYMKIELDFVVGG